jgi:hypothetical protein
MAARCSVTSISRSGRSNTWRVSIPVRIDAVIVAQEAVF